jgi:hypothetical protein
VPEGADDSRVRQRRRHEKRRARRPGVSKEADGGSHAGLSTDYWTTPWTTDGASVTLGLAPM